MVIFVFLFVLAIPDFSRHSRPASTRKKKRTRVLMLARDPGFLETLTANQHTQKIDSDSSFSCPLPTIYYVLSTPDLSGHSRPASTCKNTNLNLYSDSRPRISRDSHGLQHTTKQGLGFLTSFLCATPDFPRHSRPASTRKKRTAILILTHDPGFLETLSANQHTQKRIQTPFLTLARDPEFLEAPAANQHTQKKERTRILILTHDLEFLDTLSANQYSQKKDSESLSYAHSRPRISRGTLGRPAHAKKTRTRILILSHDPGFFEALSANQHMQTTTNTKSYSDSRPRVSRDTHGQPMH